MAFNGGLQKACIHIPLDPATQRWTVAMRCILGVRALLCNHYRQYTWPLEGGDGKKKEGGALVGSRSRTVSSSFLPIQSITIQSLHPHRSDPITQEGRRSSSEVAQALIEIIIDQAPPSIGRSVGQTLVIIGYAHHHKSNACIRLDTHPTHHPHHYTHRRIMVSTRALRHQPMPATPDKAEAPPAQANGGGMAYEMETEDEEERTLSIHRCRCVRP